MAHDRAFGHASSQITRLHLLPGSERHAVAATHTPALKATVFWILAVQRACSLRWCGSPTFFRISVRFLFFTLERILFAMLACFSLGSLLRHLFTCLTYRFDLRPAADAMGRGKRRARRRGTWACFVSRTESTGRDATLCCLPTSWMRRRLHITSATTFAF